MKKAKAIIPIIAIIIGIIIGAVPICGMFLNQEISNSIIDEYENTVGDMSDEDVEEIKEAARLYNNTGQASYYNALGINDVISYIEIPEIDVYLPIYEGTDEKTLESGIGHLENTSLPIGGAGTHCVLTGHSGLTTKTMFSNLDKLETGDKFYLHTLDEKLCYEVFNIITVLPEDASDYLQQDSENDLVTLITCTPIGINTHRLLVQGKRIYSEEATKATASTSSSVQEAIYSTESDNNSSLSLFLFLILPAVFICFILLLHKNSNNLMKESNNE